MICSLKTCWQAIWYDFFITVVTERARQVTSNQVSNEWPRYYSSGLLITTVSPRIQNRTQDRPGSVQKRSGACPCLLSLSQRAFLVEHHPWAWLHWLSWKQLSSLTTPPRAVHCSLLWDLMSHKSIHMAGGMLLQIGIRNSVANLTLKSMRNTHCKTAALMCLHGRRPVSPFHNNTDLPQFTESHGWFWELL